MGRKIFISFLGAGNYSKVQYAGSKIETAYVQTAICEKNGTGFFDQLNILVTEKSKKKHWESLYKELVGFQNNKQNIGCIEISEDLVKDQWTWFEKVLALVEKGDELWFDMTHGFRAFSIVLSAALSFIQKTKGVKLQAVYYGAHEAANKPIVDMANFYRINEWADGVSQLIETADASKIASLAQEASSDSFKSLKDKKLVSALEDLTGIIKNIDVNHLADKADNALSIIRNKMDDCSGADRQLLAMVADKFGDLASAYPLSGKYNGDYFELQLKLIEMLNKHGLYMQSFTVMRELIGSIGMLGTTGKYAKKNMTTKGGRRYRKAFGEIFITMCQNSEESWFYETDPEKFTKDKLEKYSVLKKFYFETLEPLKLTEQLQAIVRSMLKIRNGFNHAWVSEKKIDAELQEKAILFATTLGSVVNVMNQERIIPGSQEAR